MRKRKRKEKKSSSDRWESDENGDVVVESVKQKQERWSKKVKWFKKWVWKQKEDERKMN